MIKRGWLIVGLAVVVAVGVAAFASYGFRSAGGTPAQQLAAWVKRYDLGSSIGTLTADNANVRRVVQRHGGTLALHTVCGVLTTDAESANGNLQTPDTDVTQWLAQAYNDEYQAGIDCYDGGSNPALLTKAATYQNQAEVLFRRVLIRIQALTGLSLSTTTTTSAGGGGLFG